ncbi:uncharacterized protein LY89DRAFT_689534 [Mollisia scopiformis]|uniref:Rhodopsin domain-containing protein n=1 Tax=Mollisia scopiformis TaxID=149040 RepID=A0A132BDB4_MOLSC|nr:uncharacterized protein LY89DRAFT_689534 [Mollisia scopiformis]KUJ10243.1 hypothetical protein LY89DRAFT_689534 [Mollisia scopiformis]
MQLPPESVLKSFPPSNFVNPVTRGNANIILNIVLYSLLLCFMGIRIFTRTSLKCVFGADDVCILLAIVPTTIFFIISVLADAKYLWIRHSYDIPVDHVPTGLKMVLGAQLAFALACTLTKLSMLMLVRRLLASSTLFWRRVTLLGILVVATQGSVFCITVIFQCRPPQDYWKVTPDPQPNCINQASSLLVAGVINTLTDFLAVVLPIRTVWCLQLPLKQTLLIILLFAFGFISCGAGIARTYFMWVVTQTWDKTWASYPVWITAAMELYIGMICASIPATKPFFSTYLPQMFGSFSPSQTDHFTRSPKRLQKRPHMDIVVFDAESNEVLPFEKGSRASSKGSAPTITCTNGSDVGSTETFDLERGKYYMQQA